MMSSPLSGVSFQRKSLQHKGGFHYYYFLFFMKDHQRIPTLSQRLYLALPLPRVINVKFPLQPHQKHNITQYKNLAFHSLLRWKMIILPILTSSLMCFCSKSWGNVRFELDVRTALQWNSIPKHYITII